MRELPAAFAEGGRHHAPLISMLARAYAAHGANHDPLIGCDGYTFGTGIWRGVWYFADKEFENAEDADPSHPGNAFFIRFRDPGCRLFMYRARGSSDLDEDHPFGGVSGVKDHIVENNLAYQAAFDFMSDYLQARRESVAAGGAAGIPDLVLLHQGNPAEGLTRAAIGLPLSRGDANSAWVFNTTIYVKGVSPTPRFEAGTDETAGDNVEPYHERNAPHFEITEEDEGGRHHDDRRSDRGLDP